MKNKYLILLSGIVLVASFFGSFLVMDTLNEQKVPELGTIYLMPNELDSAIALKEKTNANVVVVGLLGETTGSMIKKGNVEDLIE